jgi:LPXTG-site transpeptidase (sortase) family protein
VTGSGTTYNVAVSGMTSDGTVIATIAAGVAVDATNNGNTASTSTDNTVTYDVNFPTVTSSAPSNNAIVFPGPTQLTVTFNEDVKNDGTAGAANNVNNYLLVENGPDGVFNTLSCAGGLVADDAQITINSASYTNNGGSGPFIATLNINNGIQLPVGIYRLFVCGTTSIQDLIDNELNNGLSDTTIDFTIMQQQTNQPLLLPATGFPQNEVTVLPIQPSDKLYSPTDLWLEIPKLKVKLSIVGVPQGNDGWDVTWLDKNAGWLNGSAFPTWTGNSVITAHVWDSLNRPGPFARLKELKYGDQFKIHAFGQVFTYELRETSIISPFNINAMLKHEEQAWLTLITCEDYKELSRNYTYRRMVRAVLVSVASE